MNTKTSAEFTSASAVINKTRSGVQSEPGNLGYLGEKRARSYLATQGFVIPKGQFLDVVAAELEQLECEQLTVFEPGVGPGLVPAHLIRAGVPSKFQQCRYIGADQNREMLEYAKQLCAESDGAHAGNGARRMGLQLVVDLDLTNRSSELYRTLAQEQVDVVILSQFQHYFPNATASRLAKKLSADGRNFMSKSEADRLFYDMLKPGGLLAVLDDYTAATAEEHEWNLGLWDAFVVANLRAPENLARIRAIDPEKAAKIAATYCGVDTGEAIRRCRAARESRREKDHEETWSLTSARASLEQLYGPERVTVLRHEQLPNFHLLLARKAEEPVAMPVPANVFADALDQRRAA
ncbi:MAG: class I SAM-dependent methyltransferase [Verrucomicrobiota bacterium]|jgi:hypothetical protein